MFFRRRPSPEPAPEPAPEAEKERAGAREPEPFLPARVAGQSDEDYRLALIDRIADIDRIKRDIKGQIHSNAITAKAERVSVDQVWLRRAKDKIDHLTREREEIRKTLHTVNELIRESRRAANRPREKPALTLDAAFRQAARERLPPELYDAVMAEAAARQRASADLPGCEE